MQSAVLAKLSLLQILPMGTVLGVYLLLLMDTRSKGRTDYIRLTVATFCSMIKKLQNLVTLSKVLEIIKLSQSF